MDARTRYFLLLVCLTVCAGQAAVAAESGYHVPAYAYRAHDFDTLRAGFARPPREAGPWAYWIFFDNVMSKEEISREVEELAAAGFAGAELRFLSFHGWSGPLPEGMDADTLQRIGHRKVEFLSDEFVDLLEHTLAEARRNNLELAINLGMGWPPGGRWITDEHRSKHLSWQRRIVTGPSVIEEHDLPADGMVVAWKLENDGTGKTVEPGSFLSLAGKVDGGTLRWDVPEGIWLLGLFRIAAGDLCDKGNGPEADPGSREAVLFHLNHLFGQLDPKLGKYYGTTLIDVASDSWEYGRRPERYWSPALLDAFPRLAGYDLREKMNALLGYGADRERVLEDLANVERQVVHESFFTTVEQFLHERGLGHRPQAYGRGLDRDLLQVYAASDTPEIEQGIVLPEAPWSAHTRGNPVVSAESFTFLSEKPGPVKWPHGGRWETSPALLRWHANRFFGEGFNRIQMHAFSYSPPGVPLPGWRIYAETHLNRNVPWWPYLPAVTDWIARNQWVLQAGEPVADSLVYPVRSNPADGPYGELGDRQPVSAANSVIGANEYTFPSAEGSGDRASYPFNNLILLEDVRTELEARKILQWLERGVNVVCCARLPREWTGLQSPAGSDMAARFESTRTNGHVIDARSSGWREALNDSRSVRWTPQTADLVFQHRCVRGADLYWIVNEGEPFRGEVFFPHEGCTVEIWDADSGAIAPAGQFRTDVGGTRVALSLDHFASTIMSFTPGPAAPHVVRASGGNFGYGSDGQLHRQFDRGGRYEVEFDDGSSDTVEVSVPSPVPISGPWTLSVDGRHTVSPQQSVELKLERLVSWRELPELRRYAGTAAYTAEFQLTPELLGDEHGLVLELGEVYEVARVLVNEQETGTSWYPPFILDITEHVQPGRNTLRIDVANVLKNHLEGGDEYRRPSGLLGPVVLRPYVREPLVSTPTSVIP